MNKTGFYKALLVNGIVILAFGCTVFIHFLLDDLIAQNIATIAKECIFGIVCFFLVTKLFHLPSPFTTKNLIRGLFVSGSIVWIYIVSNFITSYTPPTKPLSEGFILVPLLIVGHLSVGLCEEMMCRALGFGVFRHFLGEDRKAVLSAALLSSTLFGLTHLLNLITGQPLIQTLTQVCYAFVFGMCFSAVYYKCGNIIVCILLHALVNIAGNVWTLFCEVDMSTDITLASALITIILFIPMLVYSLMVFCGTFDKLKQKFSRKHPSSM